MNKWYVWTPVFLLFALFLGVWSYNSISKMDRGPASEHIRHMTPNNYWFPKY